MALCSREVLFRVMMDLSTSLMNQQVLSLAGYQIIS